MNSFRLFQYRSGPCYETNKTMNDLVMKREKNHLSSAEKLVCMLGNPCTERGSEENHVCKFLVFYTLRHIFSTQSKLSEDID